LAAADTCPPEKIKKNRSITAILSLNCDGFDGIRVRRPVLKS
jgi:hypothetical protein